MNLKENFLLLSSLTSRSMSVYGAEGDSQTDCTEAFPRRETVCFPELTGLLVGIFLI